jgi:hypothetical protein
VVTLHYRGLGCVDVSPYWLGDPGVRISDSESHARSGIPATYPSIGRSLTTPLLRLRPLQGPTRHGPPTRCHTTSPKGHREPDCPEGPSGAQPPRRATELLLLATLMEFPSPSTLEPRRVHSTPACLTGYVPPTGFRTLSTDCSSPERPALFHAGNAHGVSLSRGFPPPPGPPARRRWITLMTFLHRTNE